MKKSLLATLPVAAFVSGMAVVPSVFADGLPAECSDVDSKDGLMTALGNSQCTTINLKQGASINDITGLLTVNRDLTLNLNGGTITRTNPSGNAVIDVTSGTFTLIGDGNIVYSGNGNGPTAAIVAEANSTVTVKGGTLTADNGIAAMGANSTVNFEGGEIIAAQNAINSSGSLASESTIKISGGTITAGAAVVYMPQTGNLDITGGTQTGYVGVVTRAGVVNITGGTLKATGEGSKQIGDADVEFPGGVAVIVDDKTPGYDGDAKATIGAGATIEATNTEYGAVLAYENTDNAGDVITIAAGATFNGVAPQTAYLGGLVVGPNNVVMTEAEAEALNRQEEETTENPNTADPVALYVTIAAVALVGLGATALITSKTRR